MYRASRFYSDPSEFQVASLCSDSGGSLSRNVGNNGSHETDVPSVRIWLQRYNTRRQSQFTRRSPNSQVSPALENMLVIFRHPHFAMHPSNVMIPDRHNLIYIILRHAERITRVMSFHDFDDMEYNEPLGRAGDALYSLISDYAWDFPTRDAIFDMATHFGNFYSRNTHMIALKVLRGLIDSETEILYVQNSVVPALLRILSLVNHHAFVHGEVMEEILSCLTTLLKSHGSGRPPPNVISETILIMEGFLLNQMPRPMDALNVTVLMPRLVPILFSIARPIALKYGMRTFASICHMQSVPVRRACAEQLEFMTHQFHLLAGRALRKVFVLFVRDKDFQVRRLTVSAFGNVVGLLVNGKFDARVRTVIRCILKDSDEVLVLGFINKLAQILETIGRARGAPLTSWRVAALLRRLSVTGSLPIRREIAKQEQECLPYYWTALSIQP